MNREERREYQKKWYKQNKDRIKKKGIIYREKNKEKIKKRDIAYGEKNAEKIREYNKEYYKKNKERIREYKKKYYRNEDNKKKRNEYMKNRRENSMVKISDSISHAMLKALRKNKSGRHWENLVGYTLKDLMDHLEYLFIEGMNWNNYGGWQIDHIRPISSFNFTSYNDEEFKQCWSLDNLQPLWARDNLDKRNIW